MTNSKRVILANFGTTTPINFLAPYRGLVWWRKVYMPIEQQEASFWETNFNASFDDLAAVPIIINTVSYKGRQLSEINNLDDLFLDDVFDAFYFDFDNQILYVKNFDEVPPWQTVRLVSGVVTGVTTAADSNPDKRPFNSAYGGVEHEVRLIESSVSDLLKLDDWSTNRMQFGSFSLELINSDGRYDDVRDSIMNQRCEIFIAEVPTNQEIGIEDFVPIAYGNIQDVSYPNSDVVRLDCADVRKRWDDIVPSQVYEVGQGGLLPGDTLVGQNMPLVFGECQKVPAARLQDDADSIFHVSWCNAQEPLQSITEAYKLVDGDYEILTIDDANVTTGLITINETEDPGDTIYVDLVGLYAPSISITDPKGNTAIDTAVYAINVFGGFPFIDSFFDVDEIRRVRDARPYQVGVHIPIGGASLKTLIEYCTFSVNTVFYVTNEQLTIAEMTVPSVAVGTITANDLMESAPIRYDNTQYMSRISASYYPDWNKKEFQWYTDSQYEESAVERYLFTKQYDFETILILETDAAAMAVERYGWEVLIRGNIDITYGPQMNFKYLDVVAFDYNFEGRQRFPPALFRVTSLSRIRRQATLTFIEETGGTI